MKILFLTLLEIQSIDERNLYTDLMRKFCKEGHDVYIVSPIERRFKQKTTLNINGNPKILRIKTLNIQKTNLIEKGISTLIIEHLYLNGIKKYFKGISFDLILYSTPPITFTKVVQYIKKRDGAKSYLLLKDIFPQNAVDLGMIKKGGFIHKYFRNIEIKLYRVSDFIGCMSDANVNYILRHNPQINPDILEVNPNSIEPIEHNLSQNQKCEIRKSYGIPDNSTVFIFGGNIGKPQGIDFLISVLNSNKNKIGFFFIIVGSGTEYRKIQEWFYKNHPNNAIVLSGLTKSNYDQLAQSCDVGMIFLDKRFTIPNFPSRLLSYLEFKMPVIAATDKNTDLGKIMTDNNFGLWCENGNLETMNNHLNTLALNKRKIIEMGLNGNKFLFENYTVTKSYNIIKAHF